MVGTRKGSFDSSDNYEIVYSEALRAVSDQQVALDALHARTGTVASAGVVAAGLAGARSAAAGFWFGSVLVLVAFLGVAVLTGAILWPRRTWRFHFQASKLLWDYVEGPKPLPPNLMKRDLALYLERYFEANGSTIKRLAMFFGASIVLLFIEIGALVWLFLGG
jgi:hypothetical protein